MQKKKINNLAKYLRLNYSLLHLKREKIRLFEITLN